MGGITLLRSIGRLATSGREGTISDAAVAFDDSSILYVGTDDGLVDAARSGGWDGDAQEFDAGGGLVTPGLIDAHTHPLYGGSRFAEIALRSAGASYSELAAAGGGIASSVESTRSTPPDELEAGARGRLASWLAGGTTTVEAKTGYHLDADGEAADVAILTALGGAPGLPSVEVTWLAGHAVGPEYTDADAYIEAASTWCEAARAAGARHADVFCDAGYFTVPQARRLLSAAAAAGMIPRIHADELDRTGGSLLAAELGCASADHLLRINETDAAALASAGVVATVAPVTALAMGLPPPIRLLQEAGVTIALGSDHNPGTCGTTSLSLVIALAVSELGLSVADALVAATAGGAASLRRDDRGRIEVGLRPDLVLWDAEHEGAFAWAYGLTPRRVWIGRKLPRS